MKMEIDDLNTTQEVLNKHKVTNYIQNQFTARTLDGFI